MPKDFTRINVVEVTLFNCPSIFEAHIDESRVYGNGSRWEQVYRIAWADSEAEVRKKAAKLLREWAREIEAPLKAKKPKKIKEKT